MAADGILNAPDYTRTCSCSYQNQTSLGLVHMPEMDAWTINNLATITQPGGPVRQLALNIGAAGDRKSPTGETWLAWPAVIEEVPDFQVELEGDTTLFQDHPSTKSTAALPWVASSGVEGLTAFRFRLSPSAPKKPAEEKKKAKDDCAPEDSPATPAGAAAAAPGADYRVRLHFGVPRQSTSEQRVFDVLLNGQKIADSLTLGGTSPTATTVVVDRVVLGDRVELQFIPRRGLPVLSGVELRRLTD